MHHLACTIPYHIRLIKAADKPQLYLWNHLPSSFRKLHSVYSPPGSPHPAHFTSPQSALRSHHLSLPRHFTPDLKLIYFTSPFLHCHSYSFWSAFTDINLCRTKWALALVLFQFPRFYRAMHFSAKRVIAIACRVSVCPSVSPSVTLVNCDHIDWNSSKLISPLVSLGATPT